MLGDNLGGWEVGGRFKRERKYVYLFKRERKYVYLWLIHVDV